jgi:hypothetical protein
MALDEEIGRGATAKRKVSKAKVKKAVRAKGQNGGARAKYPRHTIEKSLRIPRAIIEQNAGKDVRRQNI